MRLNTNRLGFAISPSGASRQKYPWRSNCTGDAYYDGQTSFGGATTSTGGTSISLPPGTHDETNYAPNSTTQRGNPTIVIRWLNSGSSPRVTFTYDETGQIVSKLDACGNSACGDVTGSNHKTTYAYADSPSGRKSGRKFKRLSHANHLSDPRRQDRATGEVHLQLFHRRTGQRD